ncbi:MAG TPA: MFS transporter [Microbacteriaceae bacterium]|nr:MFS transporter [Microbacteriaceae bacterium]HQZ47701.1 MFS transporter [Microbacteriaceae bacterium]HRA08771.1 MFS transporter [Microbacteriaceae bacterium]
MTGQRERLPTAVWILASVTFLTNLGFGVVGPALPALADLFGISVTMASIAISGFAAFRLVASASLTGLLKRWRLRKVLFAGLLLQAVCSLAAGLAPDGVSFLVFRSISGLGSATLSVSATALLLALVPTHLLGRGMSMYFAAGSLGAISGPAVGGFLAIANPRIPLIFYGLALLVASLIAFFALGQAKDVRTSDAVGEDGLVIKTKTVWRSLMSNPVFITVLMAHFAVGWALYGARTTTVPLYLGAVGFTTGVIGVFMTVGAVTQVVGSTAAGFASDRWGRWKPLVAGILAGSAAFLVLVFTGEFAWMMVTFVLLGLAGGALAAVPSAMLGETKYGSTGLAVALYWIIFDIAAIIGPLASGIIADNVGFAPAFLVIQIPFILTLACALWAWRWDSKRKRAAP